MNNAWHGAEALHFFMLAKRQFYTGHACDAMITAMRLKLYEDVLGCDDVCSLVALTSFHAATTSKPPTRSSSWRRTSQSMPAAGDQFAASAAQRSGSIYLFTL